MSDRTALRMRWAARRQLLFLCWCGPGPANNGSTIRSPSALWNGRLRRAAIGEQRSSEAEFVAVGVNEVEEALTPFGIAGHSSWLVSRCERSVVKCVNIGNI